MCGGDTAIQALLSVQCISRQVMVQWFKRNQKFPHWTSRAFLKQNTYTCCFNHKSKNKDFIPRFSIVGVTAGLQHNCSLILTSCRPYFVYMYIYIRRQGGSAAQDQVILHFSGLRTLPVACSQRKLIGGWTWCLPAPTDAWVHRQNGSLPM